MLLALLEVDDDALDEDDELDDDDALDEDDELEAGCPPTPPELEREAPPVLLDVVLVLDVPGCSTALPQAAIAAAMKAGVKK